MLTVGSSARTTRRASTGRLCSFVCKNRSKKQEAGKRRKEEKQEGKK
jgi:hypothetical protein